LVYQFLTHFDRFRRQILVAFCGGYVVIHMFNLSKLLVIILSDIDKQFIYNYSAAKGGRYSVGRPTVQCSLWNLPLPR